MCRGPGAKGTEGRGVSREAGDRDTWQGGRGDRRDRGHRARGRE